MAQYTVAQSVKSPHATQETQLLSLGQEDPLEQEMPTCSSILVWEILQRSLASYSPLGPKSRT